ncbi:MAG: LDL receptor domain-containing protein [Polyangiales bacterium]
MVNRVCCWMVALACLGCGGDKDERGGENDPPVPDHVRAADTALTGQVRDKLTECGLYERVEGQSAVGGLIRDEFDRCLAQCHLQSSCDDLFVTICDGRGSALKTCGAKCSLKPTDGFRCDSGVRIPHVAVCDGEQDCRNGEDEEDCAPTCADGTALASDQLICNGQRDCADGSDEVDCFCPSTATEATTE